jgi:hypothetical protein
MLFHIGVVRNEAKKKLTNFIKIIISKNGGTIWKLLSFRVFLQSQVFMLGICFCFLHKTNKNEETQRAFVNELCFLSKEI